MKGFKYSNGRFYYAGSLVITNKLTGTVYYISTEQKAVVAYKGKAKKPFIHAGFTTIGKLKETVKKSFNSEKLSFDNKAIEKKKAQDFIKKFRDSLEVGTILYTSWGYDQTNVDFYQVVDKKGAFCTIREIKKVRDDTTDMKGYVIPMPNEFIGEPEKKKIMNGYIVIHSSANATPLEFTELETGTKIYKRCYTSSYA